MEDGYIDIKVKRSLISKLEKGAKESGFYSPDEYASFILEEFLSDDLVEKDAGETAEDESRLKERLKALGYLE